MKKVISLSLSVLMAGIMQIKAQQVKKDATSATDAANKMEAAADTIHHKWDIGGLINISFSQVGFSNWAAGGQNSIGLTSLCSVHANYRDGKFKWLNDAELGYGLQKVDNEPLQKTTDQIEVTSNIGYKMFDHMLLSLLANFQSQFQPGYLFPNDSILISKFFAPAYQVIALGVTYNPKKYLSVFLSPATVRLTFVDDQALADQGDFGVQPAVYNSLGVKIQNGKMENTQIGAYFKGNFSKELIKNVNLTTSLELFSDYFKNPQDVVVNWTVFLQCKVNKFISATINTQLISDNSVVIPIYKNIDGVNTVVGKGPRVQFKDVLGIGLAYNL